MFSLSVSTTCIKRIVSSFQIQSVNVPKFASCNVAHALFTSKTKTLTTCCQCQHKFRNFAGHGYDGSSLGGDCSTVSLPVNTKTSELKYVNLSTFRRYHTCTVPMLSSSCRLRNQYCDHTHGFTRANQCSSLDVNTLHQQQSSGYHTSSCLKNKDDDETYDLHLDPDIKSLIKEISQDFADEHAKHKDSSDISQNNEESSESVALESDVILDFGSLKGADVDSVSYGKGDDIYEEDFDESDDLEYVDVYEQRIPISLKRGQSGVFEVDEIVELLKDDNAEDVCVIRVPPEKKYADYLVIATGRSVRHLKAIAKNIQWIYKKKRIAGDPQSVKIEGLKNPDWLAFDIGNIVVHLFLRATREMYDLEVLWTVGEEFDEKVLQQRDPLIDMKSWITQDSH